MKQRVTLVMPVGVFNEAQVGRSIFDILENTNQIVFEGEGIVVEIEDLVKVVRVRFLDGDRPQKRGGYCYHDTKGDLQIGDVVDVSTRFGPHNLAKVVGFGLNGFEPHGDLREVNAKFVPDVR